MTLRTESQDIAAGQPTTAAERAYAEVRQRILDGRFPAGHRLKEVETCARNSASAAPRSATR